MSTSSICLTSHAELERSARLAAARTNGRGRMLAALAMLDIVWHPPKMEVAPGGMDGRAGGAGRFRQSSIR